MTQVISEQLERYERDGVLYPLPVLDTGEVAACQAALLELEQRLDDPKCVPQLHLAFRWAADLVTHPVLLDAVESILGPDLLIYATMVLTKPAGDPGVVTWHQDGTSSGIHRTPNTTAWIALWDSTPENGCVRMVPGSHRNAILPHVQSSEVHDMRRNSDEVAVEVDEAQAVDVALRAGEMSLHHSNIIHSSKANGSAQRRTGLIVRFITPAIEAIPRPVLRARGSGDCSHLTLVAGPPPDDGLEAGLDRLTRLS
ncbi:MAG TPA: phytanoyl-CoA dioxygenase family protein [Actinophytocola sp.]|uniref:phytanoyl-CoA dioxygenase family protein n=1 Tax=Actinophytocola sp. TaxID=1872138 RepID=UPI002DBB1AA4|nr:phytanoyl-CoA dioxygenase family protein [Actinophytocola sp.]HEU5475941.1 phytanoyl-CoA dioxygenase family protein [Actinophytocola sp.]